MYRFAIESLLQWKEKENRKPLLLMGARQVGKTWLMKEFGKKYYDKVAYISFYNNKRMDDVFQMDFDINRIIMNLNIESGVTITPGDTLIILDEIQDSPKVLESLKYFCEEASEYHVVAAGSLLGVAIHEDVSYPVGKVDLIDLYPLNFREFLCAVDEKGLSDALGTKDYELIDNFSEKYLFWLKNYYYTGGMPAVVESFRLNHDYAEVRHIQSDIVRQYEGDFGKHIDKHSLPRIRQVWDSIPMQLAKENKKFLLQLGYCDKEDLDEYLIILKRRYKEFNCPHELGVFLGFPLNDVKDFMGCKEKKCLSCGYWLVYNDLQEAKKVFSKYDKVKEHTVNYILNGDSSHKVAYSIKNLFNKIENITV